MAERDFRQFRVGEVRRGQVLHTFGIGAIVDLPNISVMPLGLFAWRERDLAHPQNKIVEERLLEVVRGQLGEQVEGLHLPPVAPPNTGARNDPFSPHSTTGVPVVPFPRWGRCSACELLAPLNYGVFRLEEDPYRPDRTRYVHFNCGKRKSPNVVPARHVVACPNGHVEDFPWSKFVHGGAQDCATPSLRFQERGLSSEVADLWVKCEGCGATQSLTGAFGERGRAFFEARGCSGRHPHLGADFQEPCTAEPKVILAGATNLWFPVMVPAISLPAGGDGELESLVEDHWSILVNATDESLVEALMKLGQLDALGDRSAGEIWSVVNARRSGDTGSSENRRVSDLKAGEWSMFSDPDQAPSSRDFAIRRVGVPDGFGPYFSDVLLVDRLRVVRAMTGFTRIDSPGNYGDAGALPDVLRVPLTRSAPAWVPATEVRGEGIFLRVDQQRLDQWVEGAADLEASFLEAHTSFRRARSIPNPESEFPGLRYVVLHSLAHALIRQLSIECGYSASSMEERIYCSSPDDDGPSMAGILLYTAAPDSEGTLGGLVALGEPAPLGRHLRAALGRLSLCPSDPLCSEHQPTRELGGVLHGASCHCCTFVSETSCESGNRFLDRSVLVRTVTGALEPFFDDALVTPLG